MIENKIRRSYNLRELIDNIDACAKTGKRSLFNHELRYLRRLFSWTYKRDSMTVNPAKGGGS